MLTFFPNFAYVRGKQRLLYEHKIVRYLQSCKSYDVSQGHFRETLQSLKKRP